MIFSKKQVLQHNTPAELLWPRFLALFIGGLLALLEYGASAQSLGFSPISVLNSNAATDSDEDGSQQIAADGAGNWIAVWRSTKIFDDLSGYDSDLLIARSTDNGKTWAAPVVLHGTPEIDASNDYYPQIKTDGAGNWIIVWESNDSLGGTIGTDLDILYARSTDNGISWTPPAALNSNASTDSASDTSPQIMTDGAGNWIAAWNSNDSLGGMIGIDRDILISRSLDHGESWSELTTLDSNAAIDSGGDFIGQIANDGAGNWIAIWISSESFNGTLGSDSDILFARSNNIGDSWSSPAALNSNATTDTWNEYQPEFTTDKMGNWIAVWHSNNSIGGTNRLDFDIFMARSTDNGISWTYPETLNTNAATDTGYDENPKIMTDGAGNWITVWQSNDTLGGTLSGGSNILAALSTDIGLTWSAPTAVNSNASIDIGANYYPQIATDDAGNWVVVWGSANSLNGTIGFDSDILFSTSVILPVDETGSTIWYFADGDIRNGAQTFLLLLNPNPFAANVTFMHLFETREPVVFAQRSVPPNSRFTFRLHDELLPLVPGLDEGFSSVVESDLPIFAERAMYWTEDSKLQNEFRIMNDEFRNEAEEPKIREDSDENSVAPGLNGLVVEPVFRTRATDADGASALYPEWFFAEGATTVSAEGQERETLLFIGNPHGQPVDVEIEFLRDNDTPIVQPLTIGAQRRATVDPSQIAGLENANFSAWVRSTSPTLGVFADRTLTGGADGLVRQWSHASLGVLQTETQWNFGGGNLTAGFETFLTLANPTQQDATVDLRFLRTLYDPVTLNTNADTDGNRHDSGPKIATDHNGIWITVWHSAAELGQIFDVYMSRSTDHGLSWNAPDRLNVFPDYNFASDSSPDVATDGLGNWVVVWVSNENIGGTGPEPDIFFVRSSDHGVNWTAELPLNNDATSDGRGDFNPIIINDKNGTWITAWYGHGLEDSEIYFSRSTDNGASWSNIETLNNDSGVETRDDENVRIATNGMGYWIAVWESSTRGDPPSTDFDILFARSSDNGRTWSDVESLNRSADFNSLTDLSPQIATDGIGTWIVVWQANFSFQGTPGQDSDLFYTRSFDNGVSWTTARPLNSNHDSDSGSDFNVRISTDGVGSWISIWSSNENLGGSVGDDSDLLFARSFDNGATWSSTQVLNGNAFSDAGHDLDPQIAFSSAGEWLAVWESDSNVGGTAGTDSDILIVRSNDNGATWIGMTEDPFQTQVVVPASRRVTVNLNQYPELQGRRFSIETQVASGGPGIAVERPIYWRAAGFANRSGASDMTGSPVNTPARFLPEGAVFGISNFRCEFGIGNPNDSDTLIEVFFILDDGRIIETNFTLGAQRHRTIVANDFLGEAYPDARTVSFSTLIRSVNDLPLMADRALYVTTLPEQGAIPFFSGHAGGSLPLSVQAAERMLQFYRRRAAQAEGHTLPAQGARKQKDF